MAGKFAATGYESALLQRGVSRLTIRKFSNSLAAILGCGCTVGFAMAPTPILACVAYCGVAMGGCFDYPGFVANFLEAAGTRFSSS